MTSSGTPVPTVSAARLRRDLEHVAGYGATASGGVSRTSFSEADRQVRAWLVNECEQAGLALRTDGIGNVFIRLEARDAAVGTAPVWAGSHLDSVPEGGRFDGALGSLAALEVVRRLAEEDVPLRRPVEAVVFADEEGCYHHLLGSTAVAHGFTADELARLSGRDGDLLVDALAGMGWDPAAATGTAVRPGDVHAYVELHIEQGSVLESAGAGIGVVTAIVGMGGGHIEFRGRQDHAGTTPMPLRRDALRGAGDLVVRLPEAARSVSETAVATCGILHVEPGGANVVPGLARVQLDFRDSDRNRILELEEAIVAAARDVADRHGLEMSYTRESITDPVPLNPRMQDLVATVAADQGRKTLNLPSGAGHDAQNVARLAPTGMIFVPSVDGRSHSPAELTTWEDVEAGANVLLATVHALATE
ncbi:Zn-dependent hydrolase [Pseudonocardia sp. CA-142604]|uniref:Zn-dependent hydrolase n=1 Tax=Pseudonocardia sp. CA-142604 TaxID=3240024 RepID=UPI003D9245F0